MTTIRNLTAQIFTGPIFSAAAAIALTFTMIGAAVTSPVQSPLNAAISTEYAA